MLPKEIVALLLVFVLTSSASDIRRGDDTYTNNGDDPVSLDTTALGNGCTLHGKIITSLSGNRIMSFQGLPYSSQPPSDSNRFQVMTLAEPFEKNTEWDATYIRSKCGQRANIHGGNISAAGSEDCLYLNVYVPESADTSKDELPVMIFFHGGGFVWGDSSLYLPTRLLDEDIILVTVHYRLGALSFFTTGDNKAEGNLALHDQKLSMEWVQEYISDFGGDKKQVTIFGQSAGSASVNYHLISPLSAGLMTGVIAESGSAIDVWALDPYPVESSFDLAGFVTNCDGLSVVDKRNPTATEVNELYDCMMHASFEDLAIASDLLSVADRANGGMGFRGASPSIQNPLTQSNAIITEDPLVLLQNGQFNTDVALMNGACAQEGSFVFGVMYSAFMYPNKTDDPYYFENQMIGDVLNAVGIDDPNGMIASSLKNTYFRDVEMDSIEAVAPGMIDLTGALFLKSGAKQTAELHSLWSTKGTYLYSFEYEGSSTMFNFLFWGTEEARPPFDHGVTHTDDLLYIFSLPTSLTEDDRSVTEKMVALWTNFAKYQNPTPADKFKSDMFPEWKSYDIEDQFFMQMNNEFTLQQDYEKRYTVTGDKEYAVTSTETPTVTTMTPMTTESEFKCPVYDPTYEEIDDLREAYLITMIVFIILFVIAVGSTIFLYTKYK